MPHPRATPLGNHLGHTQPAWLSLGSRQGTQRHNYGPQVFGCVCRSGSQGQTPTKSLYSLCCQWPASDRLETTCRTKPRRSARQELELFLTETFLLCSDGLSRRCQAGLHRCADCERGSWLVDVEQLDQAEQSVFLAAASRWGAGRPVTSPSLRLGGLLLTAGEGIGLAWLASAWLREHVCGVACAAGGSVLVGGP